MKCGRRVCFHGAFKSKERAAAKEAERPGAYIIRRKIKKQVRFVVVTEK